MGADLHKFSLKYGKVFERSIIHYFDAKVIGDQDLLPLFVDLVAVNPVEEQLRLLRNVLFRLPQETMVWYILELFKRTVVSRVDLDWLRASAQESHSEVAFVHPTFYVSETGDLLFLFQLGFLLLLDLGLIAAWCISSVLFLNSHVLVVLSEVARLVAHIVRLLGRTHLSVIVHHLAARELFELKYNSLLDAPKKIKDLEKTSL